MLLTDFTTQTDKFDLGYVDCFYQRLFSGRAVGRLLEIGMYRGESIRLWLQVFPEAEIFGADIHPCPAVAELERVVQLVGDAYTPEFVKGLPTFDVIIDDGPHTYDSMAFFLQHYLPLLNDGGVMVVEDIINPAWTPDLLLLIPVGYGVEVWDMRGKQKTPELLEKWRHGLDVIIIKK